MPTQTYDDSTAVRRELYRHGLAQDDFRASVAQAAGLHDADVAALAHLSIARVLTPTQLAARMRLTSGGASVLLARLKQRGYLVETPNPSDARSRLVTVAPRATTSLAAPYEALGAQLDRLMADFSPEDRALVGSFLRDAVETIVVAARRVDQEAQERRTADRLAATPVLWA